MSSTGLLLELPPLPAVLLVLMLLLVLLVLLARGCFKSRGPRDGVVSKTALPAFDLEGNTTSSALPPAVTAAAAAGDVSSLRAWISDERCVVDACAAADGSTALHTAAQAGHSHVIRLLLEAGLLCHERHCRRWWRHSVIIAWVQGLPYPLARRPGRTPSP